MEVALLEHALSTCGACAKHALSMRLEGVDGHAGETAHFSLCSGNSTFTHSGFRMALPPASVSTVELPREGRLACVSEY